jgi:nucleoid-associated protein YgaU
MKKKTSKKEDKKEVSDKKAKEHAAHVQTLSSVTQYEVRAEDSLWLISDRKCRNTGSGSFEK